MGPSRFDLGTPWVFWCGVGVGVAGVLLVLWSLLADRVRRWRRGELARRRCAKCWYDLHEAALERCPECGHAETDSRRLLRSRRRWGWATVGLLVALVGVGGVFNAQVDRVTWVPLAPSWMLVRMVDDPMPTPQGQTKGSPRENAIRNEVLRRYAAGELTASHRTIVAARQLVGRPPVAMLARRAAGGPIQVTIDPRFGGPLPREFRAEPDFAGGAAIVAYDGGRSGDVWWQRAGPAHSGGVYTIGTPPEGVDAITFRATITESGVVIWSGTIRMAMREVLTTK